MCVLYMYNKKYINIRRRNNVIYNFNYLLKVMEVLNNFFELCIILF